jgi:hypothetical protein
MSSDPNTPDFDSMSPEEMMAWMETLAKRQGADSSGFTTDADQEIDEVDPDTVDDEILNKQYIPDGWTEERWQAQLAKEEAEKQERLAKQQATPKPEPEPVVVQAEPEPAVAEAAPAVSDDGAPDYDNMSPEELMEWMESLAKRVPGVDQSGFVTSASMDIAEVDPDTVDDEILNQKYIPGNMSEEAWDAYLEKEAAQKQEKQAPSTPEPTPELVYADEEDEVEFDSEDLSTLNLDDLPTIDIHEEETRVAPSNNPMSWLENLAATDEDSEELDIPDLAGFGDDLGGLEALAQEDADSDPMDWLSSLAGDVDEGTPDLDMGDLSDGLEGLEAFALDDDGEDEELDLGLDLDLDEDDEDESLAELGEIDDPVGFLETLANLEGASEDELSTDANMPIADLDSFFGDHGDDDSEVIDFLEDTQPSEELDMDWAEDDPNSIENPEAWLEALAEQSGDDTGQMLAFDEEDEIEAEPVADEGEHDDVQVIDALNSGKDVSPEDIQNFFKGAFKKAEEFAHLDEGLEEEESDGEIESAVEVEVPDWLQELGVASPTAQAVDDDEGEDLMADVLAELDNEESENIEPLDFGVDTEDVAEPVEIPDWLTADADDSSDDAVAEQIEMPDWLNADTEDAGELDSLDEIDEEAVAEQVGIPDWLSDGAEDDSGDVIADIIADAHNIATGETAVISTDSGQEIEVDPNDTWTQAFLMEDREEDAEEWYTERLNSIGDDTEEAVAAQVVEPEPDQETLQMTSPPGAVTLESANLPNEEDLPEGQPELAPAWLIGDAAVADLDTQPELELVAEQATEDIPGWLEDSISDDDDIELPDWLNDTDTSEDPIPDWLADASESEIEPAGIPDWLNETLEDDVVEQVVEPAPAAIVATPATPAVDVSGAIKSAQQKVSEGNLDDALADYESVVRANDNVDVVIKDLEKLTKDDKSKKNPALYRVLGDAQMRNGDLQTALDTYRRALNLL